MKKLQLPQFTSPYMIENKFKFKLFKLTCYSVQRVASCYSKWHLSGNFILKRKYVFVDGNKFLFNYEYIPWFKT